MRSTTLTLLVALLGLMTSPGPASASEPPTTSSRAADLQQQVEHLGRRLLNELHLAQRQGRTELQRCLSSTLTEVNALRRRTNERTANRNLEVLTRRMAQLQTKSQRCHPKRAQAKTIVTATIPSDPVGEPVSLRWLDL